jgi:hypothetical protein
VAKTGGRRRLILSAKERDHDQDYMRRARQSSPAPEQELRTTPWVLGHDLEIENANALQRSLRFLSRWDNARVMELGAIHICAEKCKDQYIDRI